MNLAVYCCIIPYLYGTDARWMHLLFATVL